MRVTVCIPLSMKVKLGFCSGLEPKPSKSQLHETISSGEEVDVSLNCMDEPSSCGSGDHVNSAVGPISKTVTIKVSIPIPPSSSVKVRVTK